MSVIIADFATVSSGTVTAPYVPGNHHPDPPDHSMCCGGNSAFGGGSGLSGDGPPDAGLGVAGDVYVDNLNGSFYWKTTSGWNP